MKKLLLSVLLGSSLQCQPQLDPTKNALEQLYFYNIIKPSRPIRLHLGCGQTHFENYINIDYASDQHTVQNNSGADVFANITQLKFPNASINEIRSHHVFEHFDRQTALALLCAWHQWLNIGGTLIIETPDFGTSLPMLQNNAYTYNQKQSIMRHIFGSHEASWAIHCDGWYQEKFEHILRLLGFDEINTKHTQWQLTANIIITAKKTRALDFNQLKNQVSSILSESLIDFSSSEQQMLHVWVTKFEQAYKTMIIE